MNTNVEHLGKLNTMNTNVEHPGKLNTFTPTPWKSKHELGAHEKPKQNLEHTKNLSKTWSTRKT
jgi:hypothetical protein